MANEQEQIVKPAQIARDCAELIEAIREVRSTAECCSFFSEEFRGQMRSVANAAEKTLPAVEINIWRVEFCVDGSPEVRHFCGCDDELAEQRAREFTAGLERGEEPNSLPAYCYTCIKFSGPHKQSVPMTSTLLDNRD